MNVQLAVQKADVEFGQARGVVAGRTRTEKTIPYVLPTPNGEVQPRIPYEAALADLGSMALRCGDVGDVVRAAVSVLEALLDMDLVLVLRRLPQQHAFSLQDGSDADGRMAPGTLIPAEAGSQVDRALHATAPMMVRSVGLDK